MKKKEIYEILDGDGNLIGKDDQPENNPNEIGAMGTTDHNATISHQNFSHDFLGRFGFSMYNEGEGDDNTSSTDDVLNKIAQEAYTYFEGENDNFTPYVELSQEIKNKYLGFASKIISILNEKPTKSIEPTLSESELSKMIEDVITQRTDKSLSNKKGDNDILDSKVKEKLKSLLSNLSDRDKGDLIKHLNQ